MLRYLIITLLVLAPFVTRSQVHPSASDSVVEEVVAVENDEAEEPEEVTGTDENSPADLRSFDGERLKQMKADPEFSYKEPPTIGENFIQRFFRLLSEFFDSLFRNATGTDWGRLLLYLGGIAIVIVLILLILKVDAFRVFYAGESAKMVRHNVLDENIHEIDFEAEINKAVQKDDYRRAVRLVFLYALKTLSDRNYIDWEQGKTNHEYVAELKEETLRPGLDELSYYFDYAWYGNFSITREVFEKVNGKFVSWRSKIR